MPNPAILIISPAHADFLTDEFGRYTRDYDVLAVPGVSEASNVAHEITATGGHVAMLVTDSALREQTPIEAFHTWRQVVPTSKRVVVAHWDGSSTTQRSCAPAWPRASSTPTS